MKSMSITRYDEKGSTAFQFLEFLVAAVIKTNSFVVNKQYLQHYH